MIKIGLLSDTHGTIPEQCSSFFTDCKEVWHAGDIGGLDVINQLQGEHTLRAVYGNIDGGDLRKIFPPYQIFELEGVRVLIIHIGGYPNRYDKFAHELIEKHRPKLFISGHSHILKVMFDKKYDMLHINPGAAGKSGFHIQKTMIRFDLDNGNIKNLEVFEIKK